MDIMEKAEALREKANISYEEAKNVLDAAGGDLLEAMVILEHQGKIRKPETEIMKPEEAAAEEPAAEKKAASEKAAVDNEPAGNGTGDRAKSSKCRCKTGDGSLS